MQAGQTSAPVCWSDQRVIVPARLLYNRALVHWSDQRAGPAVGPADQGGAGGRGAQKVGKKFFRGRAGAKIFPGRQRRP
jgi:hypothetical protein